jgi:hypothetical protein
LCAGRSASPRSKSRYEPLGAVGKATTIKKVKYTGLTPRKAAAVRSSH